MYRNYMFWGVYVPDYFTDGYIVFLEFLLVALQHPSDDRTPS